MGLPGPRPAHALGSAVSDGAPGRPQEGIVRACLERVVPSSEFPKHIEGEGRRAGGGGMGSLSASAGARVVSVPRGPQRPPQGRQPPSAGRGFPDAEPPPYIRGRPTLRPDFVPDSEVTGSALHRGL